MTTNKTEPIKTKSEKLKVLKELSIHDLETELSRREKIKEQKKLEAEIKYKQEKFKSRSKCTLLGMVHDNTYGANNNVVYSIALNTTYREANISSSFMASDAGTRAFRDALHLEYTLRGENGLKMQESLSDVIRIITKVTLHRCIESIMLDPIFVASMYASSISSNTSNTEDEVTEIAIRQLADQFTKSELFNARSHNLTRDYYNTVPKLTKSLISKAHKLKIKDKSDTSAKDIVSPVKVLLQYYFDYTAESNYTYNHDSKIDLSNRSPVWNKLFKDLFEANIFKNSIVTD